MKEKTLICLERGGGQKNCWMRTNVHVNKRMPSKSSLTFGSIAHQLKHSYNNNSDNAQRSLVRHPANRRLPLRYGVWLDIPVHCGESAPPPGPSQLHQYVQNGNSHLDNYLPTRGASVIPAPDAALSAMTEKGVKLASPLSAGHPGDVEDTNP